MKIFTNICLTILMTMLSLTANANSCDDGGIGGTGIPLSHGVGGNGITSNKSSGIGGTGISIAHEGIGGTGVTNGIGGTGLEADSGIGGTGIVGIITGFGSICVNGLEVFYFTNTPVDLDGKKISSNNLSIGQVVALQANSKAQKLIANEIHAFYQITGPITAIDITANEIKVMGQSVNNIGEQIKNLQIGQWVSVSGLRREDGSVEASRIDKTKGHRIAGTIGNLSMQGNSIYIGGTKLIGVTKIDNDNNSDKRITGVWDGKAFNVKAIKLGPVSDLLQKVDTFYLQGIAAKNITNGQIRLSGQNIAIQLNTKLLGNNLTNMQGKNIVLHGQMKDGKATAQSIEFRPMKSEIKILHDHQINTSSGSDEKTSQKLFEVNDPRKSADKTELSDRLAKPDRLEKVESVGKVERVEVPDRIEKVDKVERVEVPDRIEKVDKVERVDKRDN